VLLTHSRPDMENDNLVDMTDYVTECLKWAQSRMMDLMMDDRADDAIALGAEFLAWADESESRVFCSPDFSDYYENET
jgi:hypothetical protein